MKNRNFRCAVGIHLKKKKKTQNITKKPKFISKFFCLILKIKLNINLRKSQANKITMNELCAKLIDLGRNKKYEDLQELAASTDTDTVRLPLNLKIVYISILQH